MARVFMSGFELNTTAEWATTTSGSPSLQTSVVRSGTYALRISSLVSGAQKVMGQNMTTGNNNGPYYFRAYFRYTTAPSGDNQIINIRNAASVRIAFIIFNAAGALELWDEDGQIGSDSSVLQSGAWYSIEIKLDASGAGATDIVEARLERAVFATSSTRDLSTGVTQFLVGGNLNSEAQTQGDWYFDDCCVNNGTGSFQNNYPGAGQVIFLRPNAAGDNADWTRAGTDSGANWSQNNEVTPNGATNYIQSNTSGQIDDYELEATPAILDAKATINVVQVGVQCRVDDATGGDPSFVLRIKSASGGTVEEGVAITRNSNVWVFNDGANPALTLYDLPGASTTPWTKATLDTAQIGIRESVSDTHNVNVSCMWLLVDFVPALPAEIININQALPRAAIW